MAKKKKKVARRPAAKKSVARKGTTKKKAARRGKSAPAELIISKARTKAAADLNVAGDFYTALDAKVRDIIASAEQRAADNNRKTLRPYDL